MHSQPFLQPHYDQYFLGIPDKNNVLNSLFSHRFESSFLRRIMGSLPPEKILCHENIFRDFLTFASQEQLDMGWTLGLHFLKWAVNHNLLDGLHHNHEHIITRTVYRWINATHRDFEYSTIIIPVWPQLNSPRGVLEWIVGKKSNHPQQAPRLFRAKPINTTIPEKLSYCLLRNFPTDTLQWQHV